jgi:hypothetical protein
MPDDPWLMRVEGALEAHFMQPSGTSRPGIDWTIGLKRGEELHRVRVRSYFADDMTSAVRADTTYLGRTSPSATLLPGPRPAAQAVVEVLALAADGSARPR